MSPNIPSSPVPPALPSAPPPPAKKTRWLLYGCGTIVALLLLMVATVLITVWWIQRPIKPVVLSAKEKAAVEEKLRHVGGGNAPAPAPAPARAPFPNRAAEAAESPRDVVPPLITNQ